MKIKSKNTVYHRTTISIPDPLYEKVKDATRRRNVISLNEAVKRSLEDWLEWENSNPWDEIQKLQASIAFLETSLAEIHDEQKAILREIEKSPQSIVNLIQQTFRKGQR